MAKLITLGGSGVETFRIRQYSYSVRQPLFQRLDRINFNVDGSVPLTRGAGFIRLGDEGFPLKRFVAQQVSYSDSVDLSYTPFFLGSGFVDRIGEIAAKQTQFRFMDSNNYGLHIPGISMSDPLPAESTINMIGVLWGYCEVTQQSGLLLSLVNLENPELAIAQRPYDAAFSGLY